MYVQRPLNYLYSNRVFYIVTKLCPPQVRCTSRDFIKLYNPRSLMQVKLNNNKIKYIIREKKKGASNLIIAKNMSVGTRHVRRLWASIKTPASYQPWIVEDVLLPRQYQMKKLSGY